MRLDRRGWAAVAAASRAVSERAITEREACLEVWGRTGRAPRQLARFIRAGVRFLDGRAPCPRYAAELARELRRTGAERAR